MPRHQKVTWLDSSSAEEHDPKHWGPETPNSVRGRMTPTKVKAIRQMYDNGEFRQNELAEMFDTTTSNIYYIVARRTWKWLP
jgi:hypothetical protein